MRLLIFEGSENGHSELYLRRIIEALHDEAEVVLAVPDRLRANLTDLDVETMPIDSSRTPVPARPYSRSKQRSDRTETSLFLDAARAAGVDHALHLFGDSAMRWLLREPSSSVPISLLLFRPRAHYPALYGMHLDFRERLLAAAHEQLVRRWYRRPDAHAIMSLDEGAAQLWAQRGANASWLPEPPVTEMTDLVSADRRGCIVWGALAQRKGIEFLTAAAVLQPGLAVTLAGQPQPGFEAELQACVSRMREAAVEVEVRARRLKESEGLAALAGARCAVLPYPRHYGMSRVLLEAASVGTPVVVHDFGLLGYLTRRHSLGVAVDCRNPRALADAIHSLTDDPRAFDRHADALAAFAARYSRERFREALRAPFLGALIHRPPWTRTA